MKLRLHTIILAAFLSAFISSPAWANHQDKVASGHGVDDTCSTDPSADNCQAFGTPFTANGMSVTPYTFNDSPPDPNNFLDVFAVTGIAAGTTVTFSFASTPSDGQFGVFTCGNPNGVAGDRGSGSVTDPGVAVDASGSVALSTSCTGLLASQSASDFLSNPTGPVTSWMFSGNGGVGTWWFYADATGPTSADVSAYLPTGVIVSSGNPTVPEPGTMLLLAAGLVGLVVLRRRPTEA
jgi:PEP-CTERM motif